MLLVNDTDPELNLGNLLVTCCRDWLWIDFRIVSFERNEF
jgi:hypothetical protein